MPKMTCQAPHLRREVTQNHLSNGGENDREVSTSMHGGLFGGALARH